MVLLATVGMLAGCDNTPAAPATPAKPRATAWAAPLALGTVTYFNTQCVACHGAYGSQIFEHNIAKESTDATYRAMVEYMVTERAASSLPARELDAQAAYCISLAAEKVFVCVKTPVMEGGLEGEVTPGSTVTLLSEKGGLRVEAEVSGHKWSISPQKVSGLKQSAGDDWVDAVIEARGPKGDVRRLVLSQGAFAGPSLKDMKKDK